jgi:saccharopine dehydrogenase-like NADP-dependent oxidoreductase
VENAPREADYARHFLKDLFAEGQPTLRVIGDVSCDPNGALEICHQTFPDNPIYIYEPGRDDLNQHWDIERYHVTTHYGFNGHGVVIMAVANLPTEFPRDASNAFSTMLKKFIPELLAADFSQPFDQLNLSRQLKRAIIIHQGKLAPDFAHLAEHVPPRVLLLGAGLMSPGVIEYLTQRGYHVTVADANLEQAQRRIAGHPHTCAVHLAVDDAGKEVLLHELMHADIAISLLPAPLHPIVAELCIEARTHLVTASYASTDMHKLDERAKAAGVILLNEVGLDPGLDHMSAMRIIDDVHRAGGKVTQFTSYCGGLPHPDHANNPLRFKASWSPAGIVAAANRPARALQNSVVQAINPRQLFENPLLFEFEGIPFSLEAYPNGDSETYLRAYGLYGEAETFIRGTLRYEGWCEVISWLHELGWFTDQPAAEVSHRTSAEPNIPTDVRKVLEWLELTHIEGDSQPASGVLLSRFQSRADLGYAPGERDLVVMRHTFDIQYPNNQTERIVSSLV